MREQQTSIGCFDDYRICRLCMKASNFFNHSKITDHALINCNGSLNRDVNAAVNMRRIWCFY